MNQSKTGAKRLPHKSLVVAPGFADGSRVILSVDHSARPKDGDYVFVTNREGTDEIGPVPIRRRSGRADVLIVPGHWIPIRFFRVSGVVGG